MHGTAIAATCNAGYYLSDNNECTICPVGYYCVDDVQIACPDPELHKRTAFPDYYYNPVITGINSSQTGLSTLSSCMVLCWMNSERGELYEYADYNPDTGQYDKSSIYNWAAVKPGYYLTGGTTGTCYSNYVYYHDVFECPAGHYCPGRDRLKCTAAGVDRPQTFGLETCPAGTSTRTNAATGADECLPLCAGGATKFHAGAHTFNIWRDRYTAPSLNIEFPSGIVCYINIAPGLERGTINVSLRDQTYHVTN